MLAICRQKCSMMHQVVTLQKCQCWPLQCDASTTRIPSTLKRVLKLSDTQRVELAMDLTLAEEVALTLVYSDGTSQLRELPEAKVQPLFYI